MCGKLVWNVVFVCSLAELHPAPFERAASHCTLNRRLFCFEMFWTKLFTVFPFSLNSFDIHICIICIIEIKIFSIDWGGGYGS